MTTSCVTAAGKLLTKWVANPRAPITVEHTLYHRAAAVSSQRRGDRASCAIRWKRSRGLCLSCTRPAGTAFAGQGWDASQWEWTGHEWKIITTGRRKAKRPQVLEDDRLIPR